MESVTARSTMRLLYPRLSLRLRAWLLDYFVVLAIIVIGAFCVNLLLGDRRMVQIAWLAILLVCFGYEPILVWYAGGTVGHRLTNLCVISQRTRSNPSLLQAAVRALVKFTLGWFSSLIMIITRRHRSIHDVLTRSDVVLRDPSIAKISEYRSEEDLALEAQLPSRTRRIALALVYGGFGCLVSIIAFGASASIACVTIKRCSAFERVESLVLVILSLACGIWFIVLAWRGRLWGSRPALDAFRSAPSNEMLRGPISRTERWIARAISVGIASLAIVWLLVEADVSTTYQQLTIGKKEGAERYVVFDPTATKASDGYVLMDVVFSFRTPQPNPADRSKPYRSIKELRAFDCQKRAVAVIERSIYPDESAKGEMILEVQKLKPVAEVEVRPSSPNTIGEQILGAACGHISRPKIWWYGLKIGVFGAKPDSLEDLTH